MSTSDPAADRRPGLSNVIDIIVSPGSAFARLREVPTWGWAFLVASLLAIAGALLAQPASLHALEVSGPALYGASPAVTQLPPAQQAQMIQRMIGFGSIFIRLQWIVIPIFLLIGALISTVVMLIANAISGGDGNFKRFYALAITTAVVTCLGFLLNGVIAMVRGPSSYETMQSVQSGVPSLALLAPGAGAKLATFLGSLSLISIWATALTALGMIAVGRVKPAIAWVAAFLMLLIAAALPALFVQ